MSIINVQHSLKGGGLHLSTCADLESEDIDDIERRPPHRQREQTMARSEQVLHASRVIERPGMTRTTTWCGRNQTTNDGMNIAESVDEATCKLCRKKLGLDDLINRQAVLLSEGWAKYKEAFGEVPHGTIRQMAALLTFAHLEKAVEDSNVPR